MRIPDIPLIDVFGRGGALKSSWYGDCLPSRDFPMLVDLYLQGRLDLDAFVSEEIGLDDVEAAFEKMQRGDVLRSVVILPRRSAHADPLGASTRQSFRAPSASTARPSTSTTTSGWSATTASASSIDAPHDVDGILAVVGDRRVKAILCTHAHDDHVRVAPALRERVRAPIFLHPADRPLWELTHTDELWDVDLADGDHVEVAGTTLEVLHTPGHAPGACASTPMTSAVSSPATRCSTAVPARRAARSATRRCWPPRSRARLFALPDTTVVHTGHGDDTTVGAEKDNL